MEKAEFEKLLSLAKIGSSCDSLMEDIVRLKDEVLDVEKFEYSASNDEKEAAVARADEALPSVERNEILKNAPQKQEGYFYLPEEGDVF